MAEPSLCKVYRGDPETRTVDVYHPDGTITELNPMFSLRNHSPDGFAWGYGGSGPTQLALALCADVLKDDNRAVHIYQNFKAEAVARWPQDQPFTETEFELDALMKGIERDHAPPNF